MQKTAIEVYDTISNKWYKTSIASTSTTNDSYFSLVTVLAGKLYAYPPYKNFMHFYDPKIQKWKRVSLTSRSLH